MGYLINGSGGKSDQSSHKHKPREVFKSSPLKAKLDVFISGLHPVKANLLNSLLNYKCSNSSIKPKGQVIIIDGIGTSTGNTDSGIELTSAEDREAERIEAERAAAELARQVAEDASNTRAEPDPLYGDPDQVQAIVEAKEPQSTQLSIEEQISELNQEIDSNREKIDQYSQGSNAATILGTDPKTQLYAMRLTQAGRSETATKLQDAQAKDKALSVISKRTDQLLKQGRTEDAQKLFDTMRKDPSSIYGTAANLESYAISAEGMAEAAAWTPLLTRTEIARNHNFADLSLDEKKEHSVELMARLDENLAQSTNNFALNEAILTELTDKPNEHVDYLALLSSPRKTPTEALTQAKPLGLSLQTKVLSPVEKYLALLSPEQKREEISKRLKLRSTLVEQRKDLLAKQAAAITLIQAGKPELVHDLFHSSGPEIHETTSTLRQDHKLEQDYALMQESLLGLSPEEQTVRARDFVTQELQKARDDLRLLDQQNQALSVISNDRSTKTEHRLASEDQKIINGLAAKHIERRAD